MNNYIQDYRTLEIDPGCSLSALKAARRRLIKKWHPDRFPGGSEHKRQAEEKIKDINTAFDRLIKYHRDFGVLPSTSSVDTSHASVNDPRARDPSSPSKRASSTAHVAPSPTDLRANRQRMLRTSLRWAVLLAAVALTAEAVRTALVVTPNTDPSPSVAARPSNSAPSSAPRIAPETANRYFTVGSSLGEVYAIQGIPTSTENGIWRYGKSRVYFANGAVVAWHHDPDDPLKAEPPAHAIKPDIATFTLGSTKTEVRTVQGQPLIETDALWDYGLSKVYFRDGRVVGWDSSPMHPLKTRKAGTGQSTDLLPPSSRTLAEQHDLRSLKQNK